MYFGQFFRPSIKRPNIIFNHPLSIRFMVEVGFRPLIPPRTILKVAKLSYFHFITLTIFINYFMHYIMIIYTPKINLIIFTYL